MRRRLHMIAVGLAAIGVVALAGQARDNAPPIAGTAMITGTVVTDGPTPHPLARAIVTVTGGDMPTSRSAITDDDGRFVIRNLPAGRVTISAIKRGYVAGTYGATHPGRPGTPVQIAQGQTFDATIRMTPTAVVTGVIRDVRGEPLAGLHVFAIDARTRVAPEPTVGRRASPGIGVDTDDRGSYRLFDLAPGTYLIVADATAIITGNIGRRSTEDVDRVFARLEAHAARPTATAEVVAPPVESNVAALAPIFFPGTAVMADATPVKVGSGDVREGIDFAMEPVAVVSIEGRVISTEGPLPSNVQMRDISPHALHLAGLAGSAQEFGPVLVPGTDGRFAFRTIVPGHYTVVARASNTPDPSRGDGRGQGAGTPADTLYAIQELDVTGQPVSGVVLSLQRGSRISGRVAFDAIEQPASADVGTTLVSLVATEDSPFAYAGLAATRIQIPAHSDGTFEFADVAPGSYRVQATLSATKGTAWWLRSAMVNGHDVLDSSLDVALGTDVTGAALTLTNRHSELSGTLQTAGGLPAPDYFIIVLPADPVLRVSGSRRLNATRPATDGRFSFADLPAGDYLLVALTDVEPNEWQQPDFLAAIAASGVKVTLGQGERKTQDLRISGGRR